MIEEEFINPIDKDKTAENPGLLPYAHTSGSAVIKPEDMGKAKSYALKAMEQQTDMQMNQLHQQIELLYRQANEIKERKEVSHIIYTAQMGFDPLINHIYYLYQKADESYLLSMVAPSEWGRSANKLKAVACVRLLADHTWEIMEKY
jgi:hypothetical protein